MAMILARKEMAPPSVDATITVVITARILSQPTFVIRKFVARAANAPSKMVTML
jgi:hypothetical protein